MASNENSIEQTMELIRQGICPRCKRKLMHEEGCIECIYCGWSLCDEA